MTDTVWRVRPAGRIGSAACALFGLVAIGILAGQFSADRTDISLIVFFLVFTAVSIGSMRSRIVLDDEWITVRNPLWSHHIRLAEITMVSPGYSGLRIERRDGTTVTAWAVQKSNWSTWRGTRTRADEVAAAIVHRAAS